MRIKILILSGIFLLVTPGWATTRNVTCSGTITTALQNAITASTAGDIVNIGAGSCTSGAVSWTDKNITVQGQGIDSTTISSNNLFNVTLSQTPASFRITGMTITGTSATGYGVIFIASWDTEATIKGWRIDHIKFTHTAGQMVYVAGVNWGLIDNCQAVSNGSGSPIFMMQYGELSSEDDGTPLKGTYYWQGNLNLGTDEAVYIEDCTINYSISGATPGVFDTYAGGNVVVRYSTINGAYVMTHPARNSERGGKKYEIYNNTFTGAGIFRFSDLRSGTGVIFNNTISGYESNYIHIRTDRVCTNADNTGPPLNDCNGSSQYDENSLPNGYWCLDQIGVGSGDYGSQVREPVYQWKNGSTSTCASGGTCNNSVTFYLPNPYCDESAYITLNRDYYNNGNTAKPGYTAYTYPHPLRGEAPATPTVPVLKGVVVGAGVQFK